MFRRGFQIVAKSMILILSISTCMSDYHAAVARTGSASLTEAGKQGAFNVGPARTEWARSFEPAAGGDVSRKKYTIPTS
jgi:cyclic beta-1,2-glucan synthetase